VQLEDLPKLDIREIAALFGVNLLSFLIAGTISWHLLRSLGKNVVWSTNIALTFLGSFLNYFGPLQLGMGAKALYLKSARNICYTDFAIITGTNVLIMVLVSGFSGCAIASWKWFTEGILLTTFGIMSLAMTFSILVLPLVWRFIPRCEDSHRKWMQTLSSAIDGIAQLWGKRRAMEIAAGLVAAQYAVGGVALWLSYRITGLDIDYLVAFLIAAFLSVSNIIPLTPNNIGVSELVMGAATQLSGADFSNGVIAGGIMRIFHLLICIMSVPYTNWQLRRLQP